MLTRTELAQVLAQTNVKALSKASGVATKTIYRLRHEQHSPTLDTVAKLLAGVETLRRTSIAD
jgi:Holliday junction resolvasome RuvABC DNA-binding subunit